MGLQPTVKEILSTRTTVLSLSLNVNGMANTAEVMATTTGAITTTNSLTTSIPPLGSTNAIMISIASESEVLDKNLNSKELQHNYRIEAHALLIGIGSVGMLTLFLIVFTVVTCIVFSMMKKRIKKIQKMESITNTYNSRDSLVTNQAYSRARSTDYEKPYDKLMRLSTSVTNIDRFQNLTSSTSNTRFSQSLPLPDIPQSLPLPPSSHLPDADPACFIPRSTTMPQISSHYTRVYDLPCPNELSTTTPQEYEQPR